MLTQISTNTHRSWIRWLQILRSGDFCVHNNDNDRTDHLTAFAFVQGDNNSIYFISRSTRVPVNSMYYAIPSCKMGSLEAIQSLYRLVPQMSLPLIWSLESQHQLHMYYTCTCNKIMSSIIELLNCLMLATHIQHNCTWSIWHDKQSTISDKKSWLKFAH